MDRSRDASTRPDERCLPRTGPTASSNHELDASAARGSGRVGAPAAAREPAVGTRRGARQTVLVEDTGIRTPPLGPPLRTAARQHRAGRRGHHADPGTVMSRATGPQTAKTSPPRRRAPERGHAALRRALPTDVPPPSGIGAARRLLGITLEHLARAADVSLEAARRAEKGGNAAVRSRLAAVLRHLGVHFLEAGVLRGPPGTEPAESGGRSG